MKRREFIAVACPATIASPRATPAQIIQTCAGRAESTRLTQSDFSGGILL